VPEGRPRCTATRGEAVENGPGDQVRADAMKNGGSVRIAIMIAR
jgi:hypothetical protein